MGKFQISNFKFPIVILCACAALVAQAQNDLSYRRNSLATLLVYHPEDEFGPEIYKAFDSLPIPDKYDDHTIAGYRIIDNSTIWGVQRKDSGCAVHGELAQRETVGQADGSQVVRLERK